jgi:hypothetical protein
MRESYSDGDIQRYCLKNEWSLFVPSQKMMDGTVVSAKVQIFKKMGFVTTPIHCHEHECFW